MHIIYYYKCLFVNFIYCTNKTIADVTFNLYVFSYCIITYYLKKKKKQRFKYINRMLLNTYYTYKVSDSIFYRKIINQ